MFLKHHHTHDAIIPDQNHIIDLINQTNDETSELAYHLNKAHWSAIRMKEASKWMKEAFPKGPDPVKLLQHGTDSYIMITWYIGQARLFSFQPT